MSNRTSRKRNGFYYINGKEYVSITKILSEVLAKNQLLYWYGQESARIALKNPDLTDKEVMAELQLQIKKTQERGQYIHTLAEQMPNVESVLIKPEYRGYYLALERFWSAYKPETVHNEIEAWSDTYLTACRIDKVCVINQELYTLDFKTGNNIYKEVGIQLAFGKHALKESLGIDVQRTAVVLLMETGEPMFKETLDTIEDFANIRRVWDWIKKRD